MDTFVWNCFSAVFVLLCSFFLYLWIKGTAKLQISNQCSLRLRDLRHYLRCVVKFCSSNVIGSNKDLVSMCTSPDCIRCSRNKDILSTALTKLSFYDTGSETTQVSDESVLHGEYNQLKKDIEASLARKSRKETDSVERTLSNPVVFQMSHLRGQEFWPKQTYSTLNALQQKWRHVALEFMHLYQSPFSETRSLWKLNSTETGQWEIAQLVDQGRLTRASELCPITLSLLRQEMSDFISGCYFGDASFSVVHPGTKIATHYGSTNCRVRCHLGLKVPKEMCILTVGDESYCWEEGEIVCFDDSYPHSVHHSGAEGSGYRAVFMVDLWHPDVSPRQREMIRHAFSPA